MLAVSNARELIERVWHGVGCHVELPENWGDFFDYTGLVPTEYDDRRGYARIHFRGKAIFRHTGSYYGVYTRDISRSGVAFYHIEQMYPGEQGRIWLPNGLSHDVQIARCMRRHRSCYECGAKFVQVTDESKPPILEKPLA